MTHDTSKETGEPSNPRFRAAEKWDTFLCPAKGGKPPEDMLSTIIIEELAEVLVEISKIRRFGIDGFHPHEPETSNRLRLSREVGDVLGVLDMMIQHGMVEGKAIQPMDGHPPPYHDCIPHRNARRKIYFSFLRKNLDVKGKRLWSLRRRAQRE
ncbi:hypothetical protein [Acetobacter persici]|uniref:Uncharacterized protein n=1 Tax=Acetobacter persici TaxID=1076596 RepID=A0A1U9LJK8_9PROT|nr:hypothetical protein [Acetobacter persici]AQT06645.1 hypothetical protein A0U91_16705 [Acetobacter persici]